MSEDNSSLTAGNTKAKPRGKPFAKNDSRINRKGRPRDFMQLRDLAQTIAHEVARAKDKRTGEDQDVIINGKRATVAEMILRQMATDPKRQQQFIEVAFGKVPTPVTVEWQKEAEAAGLSPEEAERVFRADVARLAGMIANDSELSV